MTVPTPGSACCRCDDWLRELSPVSEGAACNVARHAAAASHSPRKSRSPAVTCTSGAEGAPVSVCTETALSHRWTPVCIWLYLVLDSSQTAGDVGCPFGGSFDSSILFDRSLKLAVDENRCCPVTPKYHVQSTKSVESVPDFGKTQTFCRHFPSPGSRCVPEAWGTGWRAVPLTEKHNTR